LFVVAVTRRAMKVTNMDCHHFARSCRGAEHVHTRFDTATKVAATQLTPPPQKSVDFPAHSANLQSIIEQ
jgi:hypothetical protein